MTAQQPDLVGHQVEALAAYGTEVETGTGADALDRRPRLAAALAAGKSGKFPVIVDKLDRLLAMWPSSRG